MICAPKQEIKKEVVKEELIQEKPKTNGNLNPVKQVKKVFAEPASKDDIDPIETNEWIESLNSVIENDGAPRASYLLNKVIDQAYKSGLVLPDTRTTPYINTIPPEIEARIIKDTKNKKMTIDNSTGDDAYTKIKLIKQFKSYCLVEIEIETGRTHQIRLHAASIGHPVAGDRK